MIEKRLNSTKKYKITRQYKYLSNEFNPVSLKARYHLRQINSFLKEKQEKNNQKQSKNENDIYDLEEEEKKKILKNNIKKAKKAKLKSFVCPSDKEFKKLKNYQIWQKFKAAKEHGFKNYIKKMIPNSNDVQNLQKLINEKSSLLYDFYIIQKIDDKKPLIPIQKNIFPDLSKTIINNDNIHRNKNIKYRTNSFGFFKKIKKLEITKNKRVMSAPKIDWRAKKEKWKEKNKNIPEENYKFFLDRPISPLTNDKSIKSLPYGGGVLYSNSIWRTKKINDLIPKLNYDVLGKLNEFKKKRNQIIYKKENYIPYDLTFLSNKFITNEDLFYY